MSLPALLLLVATTLQVVGPLFSYPEWWRRLVWLVIPVLVGWQVWHDGVLLSMVPVYLLLVIMLLFFLYRSYWQWRGEPTRQRTWLRIVAVLLSLPFLAVPILEATLIPLEAEDYRDAGWVKAFDGLHTTLRRRYAFEEWKRIDWDALYTEYHPNIVEAERSGDESAYYVALREYIYNLPDGHVSIYGDIHDEVERAAIGGGFGFAVLKLNDERVIAHVLRANGPAADAGMVWGAEILEWNDQPISEAVQAVSTVWASRPPATKQNVSLAQHQLLTRAPIGAERTVTFRNPEEAEARTVTLTAYNDRYWTFERSVYGQNSSSEAVEYKVLDDDIGYLRIASLEPSPNVPDPVEEVDQAMQRMTDEEVQALIIDVRGNRGGLDTVVPAMMGYFTPERLHYEDIAYYNTWVNALTLTSLYIEPNERQFMKPVTVLVDERTKSTGEGFGLVAALLPNANVVGMHGTDGSFGMVSTSVSLPTGIEVEYPWGQSLSQDGVVQLDSNHLLEGGVQPDITVPLTLETARAIYLGDDDVVLDFAHDALQDQLSNQ